MVADLNIMRTQAEMFVFMLEAFPGSSKTVKKKEVFCCLEAVAVCSLLVTGARIIVVFPRLHPT